MTPFLIHITQGVLASQPSTDTTGVNDALLNIARLLAGFVGATSLIVLGVSLAPIDITAVVPSH